MRLFCNCDHQLREVLEQVGNLSKEVGALRRERTGLLAELEETKDKVWRWMHRTNKRARDEERAESGAADQGPVDVTPANSALARAAGMNPMAARRLAMRLRRPNGVFAPVPDEG